MPNIPKVLTIAGSDCSGGAGIQADLKTMTANKVYGMSVITSLTAQNTMGVFGICDVSIDFLQKQLDAIFSDIIPDSIKIGMLSSKEIINCVSKNLKKYNCKNIVLDPVMVSTSGCLLLQEDAISTLTSELLPNCKLLTPNIYEAEVLSKIKIKNSYDMEEAGQKIFELFGSAVLIKGGHSIDNANDFLYYKNGTKWFKTARVDNYKTHGTGCTLSSAIASNLAKGYDIEKSISLAKEYVTNALKSNLNLGKGSVPLNHMWNIVEEI